ncbi:MAG: NAD(P)/FAD-dependent oxidoreductase [Steroidobacteraceae bacterium]|jgi:L-2-hydroxyglutarate oxidase LhgO|nr:NAD(P)/FAD-dependent oxidoreductase [Steroidobacteraceae bacterium]
MTANPDFDVVVIGAGVVGLAVGRAAAREGWRVLVMDRAAHPGAEISSRNSEVIHGGLYYPTGTLKARLCVQGRHELYAYCESRSVPFRRCGKLVLATHLDEHPQLDALAELARANGVDDVRLLTPARVSELEPELRCTLALASPSSGIIDTHALMAALIGDIESDGGLLVLRTEFVGAEPRTFGFEVRACSAGDDIAISTRWLINSAGLSAPAVALRVEGVAAAATPRPYFAKGSYFSIRRRPFSRLVYPLHNEAGLGVHATIDLAGQVRFGPDVEWVDAPEFDVDPQRAESFAAAIRRYWPGLPDGALTPAYAGVRPKIVGPGRPAADFVISGPADHGVPGLYSLFGIESPGLTACLALGQELVDRLSALAS